MKTPHGEAEFERLRQAMVERQVARRGVKDPRVLASMRTVPRHRFVPVEGLDRAYEDHPIPIGRGQTISQPFMVAYMIEKLKPKPGDVALEVGAGCGYGAAVLAKLVKKVYAVERIPELAELARANLQELGVDNVEMASFDASGGWPDRAPFDGILVSAGAPSVPPPLKAQLAQGGRMVIPAGNRYGQRLILIHRRGQYLGEQEDLHCRFVNLLGQHGWAP